MTGILQTFSNPDGTAEVVHLTLSVQFPQEDLFTWQGAFGCTLAIAKPSTSGMRGSTGFVVLAS